jgi:pSer/pThr/pTyr-binding forkhead associated (FHA) protein
MPKVIVSLEGNVVREVALQKERTTVGRRPYNDIVIDNLAVSGEHAVLLMAGSEVFVEDLRSTNGTYVNGKAVKKALLHNNDAIDMGKYRLTLVHSESGAPVLAAETLARLARLKIFSGPAAGREMALVKAVTTLGKSGEMVATISRGPLYYSVAQTEGAGNFLLNGAVMGAEPVPLRDGDQIELGPTKMQFLQPR